MTSNVRLFLERVPVIRDIVSFIDEQTISMLERENPPEWLLDSYEGKGVVVVHKEGVGKFIRVNEEEEGDR
jgi:hypothetical protein